MCSRDASAGTILICDNCDDEYHMGCLDPPAFRVPDGDWYCPKCDPDAYSALRKRAMVEHSVSVEAEGDGSRAKKSKKRAGRPRSKPAAPQAATESDDSEDACMVCGFEGKLLVCDFPGCTKVFHKHCIWPSSMEAETSDSRWICPRHRCTVSLVEETEVKRGACASSAPAVSLSKCTQCTISCSEKYAHAAFIHGTGGASRCSYCARPSARVELGTIFQEAWSKMANHYLSLPFMRPFLSVTVIGSNDDGKPRDLLDIIERVRCLKYGSRQAFVDDINSLHDRCVSLVPDTDPALPQACSTLLMSAEQVLGRYRTKIQGLETIMKSSSYSTGSSEVLEIAGIAIGLQGHRIGTRLPDVTPCKPISEWQQYVLDPPLDVGVLVCASCMHSSFFFMKSPGNPSILPHNTNFRVLRAVVKMTGLQ